MDGSDRYLNSRRDSLISHVEKAQSSIIRSVRFGSRLCENALNTSKTESHEDCLWNKQAEARITLVSYIDVRNAVWAASAAKTATNGRAKRLDSRPDRLKQSCDAEDAHHSFEVVGEHMKAHFGTYSRKCFGQEVGGSHPIFERSKRMLNSLAANLHLPRIMLQPNLHRVDYRFMFPALHPTLLTRRTLLLHCAGLAA